MKAVISQDVSIPLALDIIDSAFYHATMEVKNVVMAEAQKATLIYTNI